MKAYLKQVVLFFALIGISHHAMGQVMINEFSAANSTIIEDPDFLDYADWLELYNAGPSDLNLGGYYITDDLEWPDRWRIPGDVVIASGGYLLIWPDGRDTGLHTSFGLSSAGEEIGLFSPGLELVDSVIFLPQKSDLSFGRITDGSEQWAYFPEPTPGTSNTTAAFSDYTKFIPEFSKRGGFYTSPFYVELTSEQGGVIRYTLDGSEPDMNSSVYSNPLYVEATTVLRARVFEEGMIPGPTATRTYFINENAVDAKLPVVSLASAPGNFWDPEDGIYVQNFKPLWEIPVNIELFENDGSDRAAFNRMAGAKINGLYSWKLPQKMVGIYFKKQYGDGNLDYPLINQRKRSSYKSFALRASGSDWSFTLFRDVLGHHATLLNMDVDIMGYRPSVVYFNGEYMGIHNIREKVDDDYIEKSYHLEPGSFDLVENEEFAEAGDLEAYRYLETFLRQDLSDGANYQAVEELVDIQNFTDYVITEMATGNTSIDHNVMAWKPKVGGKWRWVLMDLDRGFFKPNSNLISFYEGKSELILGELMQNSSYKEYFARRLSAQLFTSFHPEYMKKLIDEHAGDIEAEITRHIQRWEGTTSDYGDAMPSVDYWRTQVGYLKTYVEIRPFALMDDLTDPDYGFEDPAKLILSSFPEGAGILKLDGLTIPASVQCGHFIQGLTTNLTAEAIPGYEFLGWARPRKQLLVDRGSEWKYLDKGVYPGDDWTLPAFNDQSWESGNAELGYGEGDEQTVVDYGGDIRNRYITTYFRKSFQLTESDLDAAQFILELQRDDGAVVYLNGTEIVRSNMTYMDVSPQTEAKEAVNGLAESTFFAYPVDKSLLKIGENTLAVEIHQSDPSSSDISFDLEFYGHIIQGEPLVWEGESYPLNMVGDFSLSAVFQSTGNCILPSWIDDDLSLSPDCSPYLAQGDVYIGENATLSVEPGVEIWMPEGASIYVDGVVKARGTADDGILIRLNPDHEPGSWGILSFSNTPAPSELSYLTIEDASYGPDPVKEVGAISAFHADLMLDNLTIEQVFGNPVMARYSDIVMTNSTLHSEVTGDLINVKYGHARIENCRFTGNGEPDTDAIDYDEVEGGIIRNCLIHNFLGFNSDAIDIGEEARDVLIDSIFVYNITDKGVSVGQHSSVTIQNSIFINCNMGVGVKDSARVEVDRSVFYGNVDGVASFEKNPGQAGGNVRITNSILSNSSHAPYRADSKSNVRVSYSLSDYEGLPAQSSNRFGNPLFANPSFFDFDLQPGSPALKTGYQDGQPVDMGTHWSSGDFEPSLMISRFFINGDNLDLPEFVGIYNPSASRVDISGYRITKGVAATVPEGTSLGAGSYLYFTDDPSAGVWEGMRFSVLAWESGRLSNDGEAIQLENRYGIVIDHLVYENDGSWPQQGFKGVDFFQLIRPGLDNHFPESWELTAMDQLVSVLKKPGSESFSVYPNPTSNIINILAPEQPGLMVEIYDLAGHKLGEARMNELGETSLDLSVYPSGILIIKAGNRVEKVVLVHH